MIVLSNLNSIETRIFDRFLKFNRFERHSRTLKNGEIQDQKKHSHWYMAFAAEATLVGISSLSSTI